MKACSWDGRKRVTTTGAKRICTEGSDLDRVAIVEMLLAHPDMDVNIQNKVCFQSVRIVSFAVINLL